MRNNALNSNRHTENCLIAQWSSQSLMRLS
ncbi:rCG28630, isoform CRA_a [Rattus norvegicus]|uniref:RCG28630, isoform CRA_a n=1 Tax=Rattus norvegicus TaxID=10116 RepID=A6HVT8_RAT|nr:rCG28630, isoform CRA_a [Rattus norvegicus]